MTIVADPEQCWCPDGSEFWCDYCLELARAREREAVVAYLRREAAEWERAIRPDNPVRDMVDVYAHAADAVERLEHLK